MNYFKQLISSAKTSLNQIPATFKKIKLQAGSINLDYGGGKYDLTTDFLNNLNVNNLVFDPYNRTKSFNLRTRWLVQKNKGTDTVTVNNVLNVIQEDEALCDVIQQSANALKENGSAYFLIYEGNSTGIGSVTTKGYQRNEKTSLYLNKIKKCFLSVEKKSNLIIAKKPIKTLNLNLFLNVEDDIDRELKINKLNSTKIGKHIGGNIYVHKDYIDVLNVPKLSSYIELLPNNFHYDIVKYDPKNLSLSFIQSKKFTTEDEPLIQTIININRDLKIKTIKEKKDPQIYHHKWMFVDQHTQLFDVYDSKIRSLEWAEILCEKSKIGNLSYWKTFVISKMPPKRLLKI